ncbi:chemotaxis protein CheD [Tumebacillus permanentifrigoris]|jgi:chemotaxis protein CheD|uniref:Probable chemoreceptor glutamine deamidase CheD n=1 Tax=Tumebacillus permanentifrigoris TaxID=378543 RepID=A0A316D8Y4_9BACL|nr:chemotaxis protein CheD [Tumebacillus permanentifrigoris]PWK12688.1 chemotaxis protein CheD [Tumebacillus permanentifrigoris]
MTVIRVGMADLNVAGVEESLRTTGLGSCVGIALYDPHTKVSGLAHIMLPTSTNANESNRAKYANTAVPLLIELMEKKGANKRRLTAKLAGGAQMFTFAGQSDLMRIGPRNVEAVKEALQLYTIPVVAEDTGGNCGRTIELFSADGSLVIRTAKQGVSTL